MYATIGVSGPDEFGKLPEKDQIFWREWWAEHLKRSEEKAEELRKKVG